MKKEGERMEYINPIFSKPKIIKEKQSKLKPNQQSIRTRATRSDKTHNIKFPVTPIQQMQLKSLYRISKPLFFERRKEDLTQTKFNTLLLEFGLKHKNLLIWTHPYKDTKVYMHTKPLKTLYELEIGGGHGLTIQKNLSDRKVVYHVVMSVLQWIERGGSLEKIIQ